MNSLWPTEATMKSRGTYNVTTGECSRPANSFACGEFPALFHHINCLPLPEFSFLRKLDQHSGNRFLEALIIDSVGPTAARDGGSTSEGGINISRDGSAPMGGAESISPARHAIYLPPRPLFSSRTAVQIHRPFDPRSTDCKLNWLT